MCPLKLFGYLSRELGKRWLVAQVCIAWVFEWDGYVCDNASGTRAHNEHSVGKNAAS